MPPGLLVLLNSPAAQQKQVNVKIWLQQLASLPRHMDLVHCKCCNGRKLKDNGWKTFEIRWKGDSGSGDFCEMRLYKTLSLSAVASACCSTPTVCHRSWKVCHLGYLMPIKPPQAAHTLILLGILKFDLTWVKIARIVCSAILRTACATPHGICLPPTSQAGNVSSARMRTSRKAQLASSLRCDC